MATPLTGIYNMFLNKVKDYSFLRLNESGDLEHLLNDYLRGAIVRFSNCTKELTINTTDGVIVAREDNREQDLNIYELEILTTFMVLIYSTNKITSVENMEIILTKSEYYTYSQANHLDALLKVKKELQKDVSHLMNIYSLRYNRGIFNA